MYHCSKCQFVMLLTAEPSAPTHVQSLGVVVVWRMSAHPNGAIIGYTVKFYIPGTHVKVHKRVPHSKTFYKVVEEDNLDGACNTHVKVSGQ